MSSSIVALLLITGLLVGVVLAEENDEGRGEKKLIKSKLGLLLRLVFLIKAIAFLVSAPFAALTSKLLSWNAVGLSLLAFITSKFILLWSLLSARVNPSPMQSVLHPIVISSDPVRRPGPKIYIQPDGHRYVDDEDPGAYDALRTTKRWRTRRVGSR